MGKDMALRDGATQLHFSQEKQKNNKRDAPTLKLSRGSSTSHTVFNDTPEQITEKRGFVTRLREAAFVHEVTPKLGSAALA